MLFLIFPLAGALVASRRPRNPIGWILLADGLLWMLTGMMDYYSVYGVASPGSVPFPVIVAGINNFTWVPAVGVLGTYVFDRRKYDARKTLEEFGARLRDGTNLEYLSRDLVGVVFETVQPEHVTLWLKPTDRKVKR